MKRLCIFVGLTAFVLSGIASMFGVYVGWRINRYYFE
jgi:hypothetical protein